MPDLDNNVVETLTQLDPTSLIIAIACIASMLWMYRKQISSALETYVLGKMSRSKETSEDSTKPDEIKVMLLELKHEIADVRDAQDQIADRQEDIQNEMKTFKSGLQSDYRDITDKLDHVSNINEFLLMSDKEDKKAYITREYNYFYIRLKKIDLYSKETLEKIYEIYLRENGDTFVAGMMSSIRTLPVVPFITQEDLQIAGTPPSVSPVAIEEM